MWHTQASIYTPTATYIHALYAGEHGKHWQKNCRLQISTCNVNDYSCSRINKTEQCENSVYWHSNAFSADSLQSIGIRIFMGRFRAIARFARKFKPASAAVSFDVVTVYKLNKACTMIPAKSPRTIRYLVYTEILSLLRTLSICKYDWRGAPYIAILHGTRLKRVVNRQKYTKRLVVANFT